MVVVVTELSEVTGFFYLVSFALICTSSYDAS